MSESDHPELAQSARKLTALSVSDVATLLKRSGSQKKPEEVLPVEIAASTPVNTGVTMTGFQ